MKGYHYILAVTLGLLLASCGSKKAENDETRPETKVESQPTVATVRIMELQPSGFSHQIVSNGKIRAGEQADLFFRSAETVEDVFVRNGQHVSKGEPLAQLDLFKLNNTKIQQEADIDQARLEMQDVIIGQGYDPDKPESIPAEVTRLARMRSGLEKAETAYASTLKDIEMSTLKAPFDGLIANVVVQKHSMASTSEPAMRVIGTSGMTIEFPVMESEIAMVKLGDKVEVVPFPGGEIHEGQITEINPLVEENGQIKVRANIGNGTGLIEGLNARVRINRNIGDRLIVPKSAVVLRTGRQVIFTLKDGKAMWNYVTTGFENQDSYVIEEGLEAGQTVIISGNENLAHESPVTVIQ